MKIRALLLLAVLFLLSMGAVNLEKQSVVVPQLQPFVAEYKATYILGWLELKITGQQKLSQLADGRWQFDFEAHTAGAALSERSIFNFADGQIIPSEYRYSTSGLLRKEPQQQIYNVQEKTIENQITQQVYRDLWQDNMQDNLSYMLQASIDLAAGKTDLQYSFFHKQQLKSYHYKVVANEVLATDVGELNTVKLERIDSKRRTIYAWFATDHQYRLVRLAEFKNGKVAYEINIAKLE